MSHDITVPAGPRETAFRHLTIRQVRERHDLERVNPVGEIDLCTAPALRRVLANLDEQEVPNVLVDLSHVSFLALVGVRVLQTAGELRAGTNRRLVVAAPTPTVQRVLSLTDVSRVLEIYVSTASARSALAA